MSGIAGIFRRDGAPVSALDVDRMAAALTHSGPDGSGAWCDGPAGLGHRALSSAPESVHERLPLVVGDGRLVIVGDARIDNRSELAAALDVSVGLPDIGDCKLVLTAYERWGEDCPQHLLGDFAFAIWDGDRRRMFCARDHMGVKPFYYFISGSLFAFGSEIKALLALPEIPRLLNETRMADFVLMMAEDKQSTFFEGILRLPPAHSLTITESYVALREYWSLDPSRKLTLKSDEEYAEAYREVFTAAVRCRLRSVHPVGALLSGGLDTSSIVCVSRELLEGHGRSPLPTISAVWEGAPEADERPYINAVLRGGGVAPIIIQAEDLNPLADIDAILACQDEMFYGPNIFLAWELHRAARDAGVGVLLNGLHGDYAVSHGISYLSEMVRRGRWLRAAREANGLSRRVYGNKYSAGQVFWHRGVKPNIPEWLQRRPFRQHRHPLPSTAVLVNRELARRTFLEERYQALIEERGGSTRSAREEQWKDLTSGFISYNLELAGHVAAAFGVEARYPFCDRRLVEFCLALPGEQRLSGGWSRMIVRRAMAGTLPDEIRWREGKADINPHFARTLIARERRALDETVAQPGAIDAFVDRGALAQVYDRYLQNNEDYSAAAVVWSAHVMTRWLEQTEFRMPEMVGRESI